MNQTFGRTLLAKIRLNHYESFDIVHSYTSRAIPALAEIGTQTGVGTIAVLNSYAPICAKKDLFYLNSEPCAGNGTLKCTDCLLRSKTNAEQYDGKSMYGKYSGIYCIPATVYMLARQFESFWLQRRIQQCAGRLDAYHAQSPHMKKTYSQFGFPENSIHIVPNILDERFVVDHTSDFTGPYNLLYVGSLKVKKGVYKLVPVLDRLNDLSREDFYLTVAGTGVMRPVMEEQVRSRGLEDMVTFLGHADYTELPSVYSAHDIFIYPGIWDEPFARVFLESLATGTPFVGSDVGDVAKIMGPAGRVTDGSVDGFVETILRLVRNDELPTLSEEAQKRAIRYEPDRVLTELEVVYESIVNESIARTSQSPLA